jgi:hypothetical protein
MAYFLAIDTSTGWKFVCKSGGVEPYFFDSEEDADRAARIFYPDQYRLGKAKAVGPYEGKP